MSEEKKDLTYLINTIGADGIELVINWMIANNLTLEQAREANAKALADQKDYIDKVLAESPPQ